MPTRPQECVLADDVLVNLLETCGIDVLQQAQAVCRDWRRVARAVASSASWRAVPENMASLQAAEWAQDGGTHTTLSSQASFSLRALAVAAHGSRVAAMHQAAGAQHVTLRVWQVDSPVDPPAEITFAGTARGNSCVAMRDATIVVGHEVLPGGPTPPGGVSIFTLEERGATSASWPPAIHHVATLLPFAVCVSCLAFADAHTFYCAPGEQRALAVCEASPQWNIPASGIKLRAHARPITCLCAVPEVPSMCVSGESFGAIKLWRRSSPAGGSCASADHQGLDCVQVLNMNPHRITSLAIDGQSLAVCAWRDLARSGYSREHYTVIFQHSLRPDAAAHEQRLRQRQHAFSDCLGTATFAGPPEGVMAFCGEGVLVLAGRHRARNCHVPCAPPAPAHPAAQTISPLRQLTKMDFVVSTATVASVAACSGVVAIGTRDGLVHQVALRRHCR